MFRYLTRILCPVVGLVIGLSSQAAAQTVTPACLSQGGAFGTAACDGPVVGDTSSLFVAFTSASSNLAPVIDSNGKADVFVRDIAHNITELVSVANDGSLGTGTNGFAILSPAGMVRTGPGIAISGDGQIVAFASTSPFDPIDTATCTTGGTSGSCVDIYLRDRIGHTTSLLSVASDGTAGNNHSDDPRMTRDGRFVIFNSIATNLVAGDTNGVEDVFVRDRVANTTTRVSVATGGGQLAGASYGGQISGDGQIVAFITEAAVVSDPDPLPCLTGGGTTSCARAYVLDRNTGTVKRVPIPASAAPGGATVLGVGLTPDGRYVAVHALHNASGPTPDVMTLVTTYDRQVDRAEVDINALGQRAPAEVTISDNGRFLSVGGGSARMLPAGAIMFDRQLHATVNVGTVVVGAAHGPFQFVKNGTSIVFADDQQRVPADPNGVDDVWVINLDTDGDEMPDAWEMQYGLDPNNAADATGNNDGDLVSNLQEYLNGTNPKGTFKRYFAEGAANQFFTTRLALFNPNDQPANVVLEFLGSNEVTRSTALTLAAHGWTALTLDDTTFQQPDNDFSTIIESDQPVVADRTMSWDKTGYGSHAETSIESPGRFWYMAEGSTGGSFDLFYLLQNPNDAPAEVSVTYLLPTPAPSVSKHYTVPARSRRTIHVDDEDPAVQFTDVSAIVISSVSILVERAMYFSTPTQPFAAGHEGAAVQMPQNSWFFAEGATGSFFDLFLLVANAQATDVDVKVTYLLPAGDPIVKHYEVKGQSRKTIQVDGEDPRLLDTPVSMIVESVVPIIAERAMWWPSPNWYEAHLSAGATTTGTKWALADGLVTSTPGTETETFILIANTGTTDGSADVTLFFGDGTTLTKTFTLPANSRTNVRVQTEFPDAIGKGGYGTIIQSNGVPIVVERAMYSNANGQIWAAGTDALATKLQ